MQETIGILYLHSILSYPLTGILPTTIYHTLVFMQDVLRVNKITNIRAISKIARQHDCLVVVDNTFASSALQKPLDLSTDIVFHSATTYIDGQLRRDCGTGSSKGFGWRSNVEISDSLVRLSVGTEGRPADLIDDLEAAFEKIKSLAKNEILE